jgi:hypothetical protein
MTDTRHDVRTILLRAVTAIAILTAVAPASADDFCNGFERGYATGYRRASGSALDPLTPLCPPRRRMS